MADRYFTQNMGYPRYSPQQTPNVSMSAQSQQYHSRIPHQNFSVPPPNAYYNQSTSQSTHSINYHTGSQPWGLGTGVSSYPNCEPTSSDLLVEQHAKPNNVIQVEADKEWVHNFLRHIGKATAKALPNVCSDKKLQPKFIIYRAKESVDICLNMLQDLKNLENKLSESVSTLNSEEWNNTILTFETKKQHLTTTLNTLKDPLKTEALKIALKNRRKKRQAQKRNRVLIKQRKMETHNKRKKLHLAIDTWLEEMQLSVEKVKSEESLKRQADLVLADVTRKKIEARRQLALLLTMVKLRQLRVQAATNRGERISLEQVSIFENVTKNLQTFWTDQLKGYNLEEKGLKVMLEEETQEQVKRNGISLCRGTLIEWQKLLFGVNTQVENGFTVANRDIDFFVAVRRDWDKFYTPVAAPMSTAIPIGWVMPVKPSSAQWDKLLVK